MRSDDAATLRHPVIDGVLSAAATLLGMELVFIGGITEQTFTFERVRGALLGPTEGERLDRVDTFCHRMLAGAPPATHDAISDPHYAGVSASTWYGVRSYVGVPVRDRGGAIVATLCGVDRGCVEVNEVAVGVLRGLAEIVATHLSHSAEADVVIRRTPAGWQVGEEPAEDLTAAMVLADLLAAQPPPGARPPRPNGQLGELDQLRLSVAQLQHALATRVVVEQAIGVLAERQGSVPRDAFERLRRVARSRGRKVHELAREVVTSAATRGTPLPPELAGPR